MVVPFKKIFIQSTFHRYSVLREKKSQSEKRKKRSERGKKKKDCKISIWDHVFLDINISFYVKCINVVALFLGIFMPFVYSDANDLSQLLFIALPYAYMSVNICLDIYHNYMHKIIILRFTFIFYSPILTMHLKFSKSWPWEIFHISSNDTGNAREKRRCL